MLNTRTHHHPLLTLCVATLLTVGFATSAQAQWAWKDDKGQVVYSDRPPPSSVPASRIVRQPGTSTSSANSSGGASEGKESTQKSWVERDAEYKKRQAEKAEADKKSADEANQQAQKRASCERARSYLATLESGTRISKTDPNGEKVFLDDAQREAEVTRAREAIANSCS